MKSPGTLFLGLVCDSVTSSFAFLKIRPAYAQLHSSVKKFLGSKEEVPIDEKPAKRLGEQTWPHLLLERTTDKQPRSTACILSSSGCPRLEIQILPHPFWLLVLPTALGSRWLAAPSSHCPKTGLPWLCAHLPVFTRMPSSR